MSKFKASRPDPVKLLEELRLLMAKVHASKIELDQIIDENLEFTTRWKKAHAPWQEEHDEREKERRDAAERYSLANNQLMQAYFPALEAMIEDMKG